MAAAQRLSKGEQTPRKGGLGELAQKPSLLRPVFVNDQLFP
jgi:hypothetical protein